jgi:hypothetical protein
LLLEAFETACSIDYEDDAAALHAVYAQFLPEDFFDRALTAF